MSSTCHCGELCYHGSQEIHDTISSNDMHDHSLGLQHLDRSVLQNIGNDWRKYGHIVYELHDKDRHQAISSVR